MLALGASASAQVTVDFSPTGPEEIGIGENLFVDLLFGGLGEGTAPSLGVFDIDVTNSNPGVLMFAGADFGDLLGVPEPSAGETITEVVTANPSPINVFELSLLSESELDALQPASFGPSLNVTVTPVPAALPLLGTALAGLGLLAWRRRSS